MVDFASKSEKYFKEQNLKQLTEWLELLNKDELYIRTKYYKSPKNSKIKAIVHLRDYDFYNMSEEQKKEYEPIIGKNKEIIEAAYKREIEVFEKRLNTYLKKYGTSKLNTWSYWQDA